MSDDEIDHGQSDLERRRAERIVRSRRNEPQRIEPPATVLSDGQLEAYRDKRERLRLGEAASNRAQVEHLRGLIQRFKASYDPQHPGETADIVREMRATGHPDVDGLVAAVHTRLTGGSGGKATTRRGDL